MQRVTFRGKTGERLAARLELPASANGSSRGPGGADRGEPVAFALFAHCFACAKDSKAAVHVSRALTEAGLAVLRFDVTGLGESEGDFAETSLSRDVGDLLAAAEFLAGGYRAPQLLVGHSLGGAAVLRAAHSLPSVRAVATIGAPSEPRHLLASLAREEGAGDQPTETPEVVLAGRRFKVTRAFAEDLRASRLLEAVSGLRRALLVLHAPQDEVVGIDHAAALFTAAKHPKSFVSLDGADHLLSGREDARYAGKVIAAWAERFLTLETHPAWWEDAADNRVAARTETGFYTEVRAGKHGLVVDEPTSVGGSDLGPTPYDLLAASLASCTSMTLRMYADRKGWPLEAARVGVTHAKVHAEDCEACEGNTKLDRFEREVALDGALDEAQRARLLEIADRCPVHKTLHGSVAVRTVLTAPTEELKAPTEDQG